MQRPGLAQRPDAGERPDPGNGRSPASDGRYRDGRYREGRFRGRTGPRRRRASQFPPFGVGLGGLPQQGQVAQQHDRRRHDHPPGRQLGEGEGARADGQDQEQAEQPPARGKHPLVLLVRRAAAGLWRVLTAGLGHLSRPPRGPRPPPRAASRTAASGRARASGRASGELDGPRDGPQDGREPQDGPRESLNALLGADLRTDLRTGLNALLGRLGRAAAGPAGPPPAANEGRAPRRAAESGSAVVRSSLGLLAGGAA